MPGLSVKSSVQPGRLGSWDDFKDKGCNLVKAFSLLGLVPGCSRLKSGLSWDCQVKHVPIPSPYPCISRCPQSIEVSAVGLPTWWLRAPVSKQALGIPKGLTFLHLESHVVCKLKGSSHRTSSEQEK